jgi:branched-chain amino acid transport system substrate-binding protein
MKISILKSARNVLIAGAVAAGLGFATTGVQAADTIKIGVSLPLTGDWAEYGDFIKKSVTMVIDKTNKEGGIDGKKIELVIADSRGDPKEAVLIAEKFVANPDIIAEIGDFSSSACMAAAPIYEKANMSQVSPTSSHPDFTKKGKNMFRVIGTQAAEGPFNAKWAVTDLGAKTVATIYINNDWGVAANKYFTEAVEKLGGKVVAMEAFTPGEKDFSSVMSKIKRANPDVLYLPVFYADASAIMSQARRIHYKPTVLSSGSLYSPKLIELGGKSVEGLMTSAVYFPNNPSPESKAFTEAFRATYNKTPSMFAAVGHDAAMLVVAALKKSGAKDRASVAPALESLGDLTGITGKFDYSKSHDPAKTYAKIVVKDGKWSPVE